jgi:hypothetical protein
MMMITHGFTTGSFEFITPSGRPVSNHGGVHMIEGGSGEGHGHTHCASTRFVFERVS